ncbi:BZ3500_MvSof-1268-A1-R1_Chr4-3g07259 [Microbotryum saponariae]|uniref:S-formylglutathione hydrolase n=1 Tax=Microbotryum saponariae TaxID=289078 RepID=A0A2X0MXQ1_9BASI|nr:BZ3500_MvSof-1268-A1-R1_Chr4-3g07259 [Microbotryum saponariae]SDA06922.1 BZ3501_MvSof-1269-A2-R1_Chr4-2g06968 [Microbotryum saponariae]
MSLEQISQNLTFDGTLTKYKTTSASLGGLETQFNVFVPKQASASSKVPVLYYLAGLTCNEDTAPWKGGFIRDAAQEGIALVFPDTSPRGAIIQGEDKDWDFGTGAGFYLNATHDKYAKHYNMYDFITSELPSLLSTLPIDTQRSSIFGHSMGGHGALVLYLKTKGQYRSASAFAPITNPTKAPWGEKAFSGYLQGGVEEGQAYDATHLIADAEGQDLHILVDVGTGDDFYKKKQLLPENFIEAAKKAGFSEEQVKVSLHEGYDHSYYFISTFAPGHVKYHAKYLKA